MKFVVASVDSFLIYFGDSICESTAKKVRIAYDALKKSNFDDIVEVIPSYTSLFVSYDCLHVDYENICERVKKLLNKEAENIIEIASRDMSVPVLYDIEVGLDLLSLSEEKKLSIGEIISIHSCKEYFVYAIGFAPGFPYMGEVDERIASKRLANPRAKVPKGSVGIAGLQTAIYPRLSPGGWKILGRTPIEMFDKSYDGFSYLRVGDRVKFEPINKKEFLALGGKI